jgi:hypothetical protein
MRTFIDFKAFGYDLLILINPHQGWQRWFTEPVGDGTAFWLGPLHGALCKTR